MTESLTAVSDRLGPPRRTVDYPPLSDISPIRVFSLPATPAEFRAMIGLGEQPLISPEEIYEEKRRRVEEYVDHQAVAIPRNFFAGGELQRLDYQESRIQRQVADQNLATRIWRGWMRRQLTWAGVEHAAQLIQTIEENVSIGDRKDLKPSTLILLLKASDQQDEVEALKKMNLAFNRARQFCLIAGSGDLRNVPNQSIEFIGILANTPEDKWQEIYHQFDGRTQVIYNSIYGAFGEAEGTGLIQIIKQGGLTTQQQQTLTKAAVWKEFGHALPVIRNQTQDRGYESWLYYDDLLNPAVGQQIDKYYPYLVDRVAGSLDRDDKGCGGGDFIVGLQHLESTGKLALLENLINTGWDCKGIYRTMDRLAYHQGAEVGKQLENIDQILAQATTFQANPDNIGWVKAFNEYFHGMTKLFTTQVSSYEEMIRNKDDFVSVALILKSLPQTEDFKPGNFLKIEEGQAKIDRRMLSDYLEHITQQANLPDLDKRYIKGLLSLMDTEGVRYSEPKYLSAEKLSFYLYLAVHKDRVVPQMYDSRGNLAPQASFLNDLSNQGVTVDSKLMEDFVSKCANQGLLSFDLKIAYFDKMTIDNRVSTLVALPDELLVGLPAEIQASIAIFRQLPVTAQSILVFDGLNGLSKYINNRQPTAVLVDSSLAYGYFQEIRHFLTPELISSFAPEQGQAFQACLNLPPDVVKLMQGSLSEWKRCLSDGKPTPAFLRMVALKSQHGEIDIVLATTDLSTFSPAEQAYWSFYNSIPQSPYMRSFLLQQESKFSQLVVNGQLTPAFLEVAAQDRDIFVIREILPYIKIDELPVEQQAFWRHYPVMDQQGAMEIRDYLLQHRNQFTEFIEDGRPTLAFFNQINVFVNGSVNEKLIQEILDRIDRSKLSPADNIFWQYYSDNRSSPFSLFILRNKNHFAQMVEYGQETSFFYQMLAIQESEIMLNLPHIKPGLSSKQYQDIWRVAIGKEVIDSFLAALPTATDEARNAFTTNTYDRTSEFIWYLKRRLPADQFELTAAEFSMMARYVSQFGLARNEAMYRYYRILYLFEHQQIADLPDEMKALRITSTAEMIQKIDELKRMVYGERQLTDPAELRNLTLFERQMLANVTGYDTARFDQGDANRLSAKIDQFAADLEQGLIIPIPSGYGPESVEASSIKVEFNGAAIKGDYEILRGEILECIDNPPTVDRLKVAVREVIERRIGKIHDTLSRVKAEGAVAAMTRDLDKLQSYLSQLDQVADIDFLTLALLGMNFSNEDRRGGEGFTGIDSVIRRIILSKLYRRDQRSPGFIENTRIKLSKDEITAEGIDEIILTVDEMIKNHVLSLDFGNKEGYWRAEVFKAIIANESLRRNFRRFVERFNPQVEKLRQEQTRFVKTQTGKVSKVKVIPDRGFIGEMAGYLADVCYVRVGNLLKTYSGKTAENPLVIPYKFVIEDSVSAEPRFIGSVLIFETQTAAGEPSILVRALDIPNESEIDISKFTESLLDKFAEVVAKRGRKKVQLAGTPGTISNYSGTISHLIGKYVKGKDPDPVSPTFDFNGYNITDQIYTARIIGI
ncbi:hypothetical protein HYW41_02525 [Candidatus Daviesbacteria bacterium]|nr:hypothetical protein [Candidatus Daviesbacteria bacterium]